MPNTTIETPDWLREMGTILEELNEGVALLVGRQTLAQQVPKITINT